MLRVQYLVASLFSCGIIYKLNAYDIDSERMDVLEILKNLPDAPPHLVEKLEKLMNGKTRYTAQELNKLLE